MSTPYYHHTISVICTFPECPWFLKHFVTPNLTSESLVIGTSFLEYYNYVQPIRVWKFLAKKGITEHRPLLRNVDDTAKVPMFYTGNP